MGSIPDLQLVAETKRNSIDLFFFFFELEMVDTTIIILIVVN